MDLSKISKCGKMRNYEPEAIICMEGQEGHTAYLILQGNAEVKLGSFKDKNVSVATIPSGAIFGEMSLLENARRSATVQAGTSGCMALEIGKDDFLGLMKTEPELAFNLLRTLVGRIENIMDTNRGYLVADIAEIRRNVLYGQIQSLNVEQFAEIVSKDDAHALKLLTYLSHTLATFDRKIMDQRK